jgi:hypothetical protein
LSVIRATPSATSNVRNFGASSHFPIGPVSFTRV